MGHRDLVDEDLAVSLFNLCYVFSRMLWAWDVWEEHQGLLCCAPRPRAFAGRDTGHSNHLVPSTRHALSQNNRVRGTAEDEEGFSVRRRSGVRLKSAYSGCAAFGPFS